ncbi:MAG: N-6 DNA methylase [Bacteroidaceae bacterium]|nr:N-6 DNA methylase [Bacteroidaceae bacterium]
MIQLDNLKEVLSAIGFVRESMGEFYKREYGACVVSVDCDNKKIIYPEDKGLIVNDKTTSNFEHPENFVVLECVCRLLEKGYRPEHIELEPRWTLGHDAKGGKADILVKNNEGKSLLIIECKTAGTEFNKEKKNTEEDGGQLFSYWQQEISTRWLALYASDWKEDTLTYNCLVINCSDDANIVKMAEKDKDVKIYANARNDKERFEVWEETYQKQWLDDVVFNEESQAYNIGIPPLRKRKLKDFTPDDRIVNRFEEILRHNNVSDKENAFNRLVALFICKLVDEIKKQDFDVVEFQYKQGQDTYEILQDRLQHLHQQGMEEFMKEKIFYVEADYAERLFKQYTGRQRKAAIEDLNRTIRILKFYSNNDFAFKDVHNEELFYQNGKILVEVVQLFQPYRIVYPSKHQFLGDLFEQLLNKGFKQNEGQFFTPTPITRFIWDSLPLQNYINEHDLPRVIDYACGAGHFLTEGVEAINAVRPDGDNSWVEKHIYGVEKDYRLARVSKISMFMNGAGGSNIIFGDGLENYPEKDITPASFDILVANPPYAVKGFKQHLKLKNNGFSILDKVSTDGDEIEMLFVERISQLLKPKGIAAVVLPSSILNDTSSSGIAARESLLQNFFIHSIVAFGSQTFGATGTNTVTLFLERFNEPPRLAELAHDTVNGILANGGDAEWEDKQVLEAYVSHQKINLDTYLHFIKKELSKEDILSNAYLKSYAETFAWESIKYPQRSSDAEKAQIRKDKFYAWALAIEKEKLYYFSLVYQQQTLVITAPSENKEQKDFLGYEWSNRKGAEGIKIKQPGGKLYNAEDRFARGTLACAVRNSFHGASILGLSESVNKFVKGYFLKDMVEFALPSFAKTIALNAKIEERIQSKYPLIRLNDPEKFELRIGRRVLSTEISDEDKYPVYSANVKEKFGYINRLLFDDFDKPSILWGIDGDWMVSYIEKDTPFFPTDHCGVLRVLDSEIEPYYISLVLESVGYHYGFSRSYRASTERIAAVQIPMPPLTIQKRIVKECEAIDKEYNNSRMSIETYRQKIAEIFDRVEVVSKQMGGG